jgi:hypothetical protein
MNDTTNEEFSVLHALKVRGMATAGPVSESTGIPQLEVQTILDDAVARQLARSRTGGRVEGYMLTKDGRERHSSLREQLVRPEEIEGLAPAYDAFLAPNREFKQVTTDWQMKAEGDITVVLPKLETVHQQLGEVLTEAANVLPRMKLYQPRFDAALAAFSAGDGDALAKPMTGSYHDVWMELHEDLLTTLGIERKEGET